MMITIFSKLVGSVNTRLLHIIAGFCIFVSACQAGNNIENFEFLTVVRMEKLEIEIFNQKGRCAIRVNSAPKGKLLNIPYPCGFVRSNESLAAQTYHYEEVGQVFVVAGPVADKKAYKENTSVNPKHMCSNQGQAIIIRNSKLILRQSQNILLGFCHYLGFDEKDYYGFAYPIE